MPSTPREIVTRAVKFQSPERLPRELWYQTWGNIHFPDAVKELQRRYPNDMCGAPDVYRPSPRARGDTTRAGAHVDEWGCTFVNLEAGVLGEVRDPILRDISDWRSVRPPYETLPESPAAARDAIARFCAGSDLFVSANCCPRPWERCQFLRGSENALLDLMTPDAGFRDLLRVVHEFHLKELEFWASTEVDCIRFMDDWGGQRQLLIPPALWREFFKPLYREYCELIHSTGKLAFMHSDGHISEIYEDLIEVGVDAVNSQLFCMDMADLARRAKGRITFWGEIDRQHVLPSPDPEDGRRAVREVARHFYDPRGGVIAQFEFGPGANPATALAIMEEWESVQRDALSRRTSRR